MRILLAIACLAACSEPPLEPLPPPACTPWLGGHVDTRFVSPGVQGAWVNALARLPDGRLVVGGAFTSVVDIPARYIAVWDGHSWSALGGGAPAPVASIVVDDAGVVWTTTVLGDLERWDGEAGTQLTPNVGNVRGISAVDGGVAVFGSLGVQVWSSAGGAGGAVAPGAVSSVARTPGGFCALGSFQDVQGAACWDGTAWTPLGGPVLAETLVRGPDGRWWAGGGLASDAGHSRGLYTLDAQGVWQPFEGGLWRTGALGDQVGVSSIAFDGADVLVAGAFDAVGTGPAPIAGVARWTPGRGWSAIARISGAHGVQVNGIVVDGDRIHVAGTFADVGGTPAAGVATIDAAGAGMAWTGGHEAIGPSGTVRSMVATPDGMAMTGAFAIPGGGAADVAVFDGAWRALHTLDADFEVVGLAVRPDGTLAVIAMEHNVMSVRVLRDGTWQTLADDVAASDSLFADGDGGLLYLDASGVVRLHDGEVTKYGLPLHPGGRLVIADGDLVWAGGTADVSELWRFHDGDWRVMPSPPSTVRDIAMSPRLGLLAATDGGVFAWDGTAWAQLDAKPAASVAACADGAIAIGQPLASGGEVWFYDGDSATPLPFRAVGTPVVAPDGLYVRDTRHWDAPVVRFGN